MTHAGTQRRQRRPRRRLQVRPSASHADVLTGRHVETARTNVLLLPMVVYGGPRGWHRCRRHRPRCTVVDHRPAAVDIVGRKSAPRAADASVVDDPARCPGARDRVARAPSRDATAAAGAAAAISRQMAPRRGGTMRSRARIRRRRRTARSSSSAADRDACVGRDRARCDHRILRRGTDRRCAGRSASRPGAHQLHSTPAESLVSLSGPAAVRSAASEDRVARCDRLMRDSALAGAAAAEAATAAATAVAVVVVVVVAVVLVVVSLIDGRPAVCRDRRN